MSDSLQPHDTFFVNYKSVSHLFDKGLESRKNKEPSKLNNREKTIKSGEKIWTDTSSEKIKGWQISTQCLSSQSSGKRKYKQQWYTNTHPLEWLTFERLNIPSVGQEVEELELSCTAGGRVKQQNPFEK